MCSLSLSLSVSLTLQISRDPVPKAVYDRRIALFKSSLRENDLEALNMACFRTKYSQTCSNSKLKGPPKRTELSKNSNCESYVVS